MGQLPHPHPRPHPHPHGRPRPNPDAAAGSRKSSSQFIAPSGRWQVQVEILERTRLFN